MALSTGLSTLRFIRPENLAPLDASLLYCTRSRSAVSKFLNGFILLPYLLISTRPSRVGRFCAHAVFPLKTKGKDGWPDISVGGPGFCFPVQRWNGKAYELNRCEYEGKRCKPPR
jgi:hypothetical protein